MVNAKDLVINRKKKAVPSDEEKIQHADLDGLKRDDHPIYHTDARGDARYYTKATIAELLKKKAAVGHTHDGMCTTAELNDGIRHAKNNFKAQLGKKADLVHKHNEYAMTDDLQQIVDSMIDSAHEHKQYVNRTDLDNGLLDVLYYKRAEIDKLISLLETTIDFKANRSHNHDNQYFQKSELEGNILGRLYATREELEKLLIAKAEAEHIHPNYEVDFKTLDRRYINWQILNEELTALRTQVHEEFAPNNHTHREFCTIDKLKNGFLDERYFTRYEIEDIQGELLEKLSTDEVIEHSHDSLYYSKAEVNKIRAAINKEIQNISRISHSHDEQYYLRGELDFSNFETTQSIEAKLSIVKEDLLNVLNDSWVEAIDEKLFYLASDLDSGKLDVRYFTKAEIKELMSNKASTEHSHSHSGMSGLKEDDHPQYILADGSRKLVCDWDIGDGIKLLAPTISARSLDGLRLTNYLGYGIYIDDEDQIGIGTKPVKDWPVTIQSRPSQQSGLLLDDGKKHYAYARSSEVGAWFGSLSDHKVLFTVGGTSSNHVFLECDKSKIVKIPERLQLNEGTSVNEFSVDGTLSGNSTFAVPTEKAVKTYVDNTAIVLAESMVNLRSGRDELKRGVTRHLITFEEEFEDTNYTINATLRADRFYNYIIKAVAVNGFYIEFSEELRDDVELHWTVIHD